MATPCARAAQTAGFFVLRGIKISMHRDH